MGDVDFDERQRREKTPGQFRRIQDYIGSPDERVQSAIFVPPPPGAEMEQPLGVSNQGAQHLLGQLEAASIIHRVDRPGG